MPVFSLRKQTSPGVKELYRIGSRFHHGNQCLRNHLTQHLLQLHESIRFLIHQSLQVGKWFRLATLHQIAGEGKRGSGKTDQCDIIRQLLPYQSESLQNCLQALPWLKTFQCSHIGSIAYRIGNLRSMPGTETQIRAHRNKRNQNIAEQN